MGRVVRDTIAGVCFVFFGSVICSRLIGFRVPFISRAGVSVGYSLFPGSVNNLWGNLIELVVNQSADRQFDLKWAGS